MFDEIAWLEHAGHDVAHFSTSHPDNQSSPWSDYFAPYIELGEHAGLATRDRVTRRGAHVLQRRSGQALQTTTR